MEVLECILIEEKSIQDLLSKSSCWERLEKTKKTENSLFSLFSPTLYKMYINPLFKGKIRFPPLEERHLLLCFSTIGSLDSLLQLFFFFFQNFCSNSAFWCARAHPTSWLDSCAQALFGLAREHRCTQALLVVRSSGMPWQKTCCSF
jgi:hypothetical protein